MNNAGIFLTKPFTDFTTEDFDALVSTNLLGFFYVTQYTVKEMLKQKLGCVVSITAALADRPIAGENSSISMITKGGLNSATKNLAIEYAKDGIRFNAVASGVVDTLMHRNDPTDSTLQPAKKKGDGEGYCRCRSVPGTGRSCERRDPPRGWCRSHSSLVAARQFNIVPAACPPIICEAVQADARAKQHVATAIQSEYLAVMFWSLAGASAEAAQE